MTGGGLIKDHLSRPDLGIQDLDRRRIAGGERLQERLRGNARVRDPEHIRRAGGVLDLGRQLVTGGVQAPNYLWVTALSELPKNEKTCSKEGPC